MADPEQPDANPSLVPVSLSDGTVVRVRQEDVAKVEAQGGAVATPEQIGQARDQWEYSGLGSTAKAAGAAALRGATLGLSDVVIGGLGGSEELEKLRRWNPRASFAGELAGTVAGGFVGGPVSAANAAGAGIERLAASAVGKGILSTTARGIGEGAIFGVGGALTEAALGDDYSKLGELLSSQIGLGALMGGGAGLGLALASKGVSALTSGMRSTIEGSLSRPSVESLQRVADGAVGGAAPGVGDAIARTTQAPWYAKVGARISGFINPKNDRSIVEKFLASPEARSHVEHYESLIQGAGDDLYKALVDFDKTVEHTADHFIGSMKRGEVLSAIGDADRTAASQLTMKSLGDFQSLLSEIGTPDLSADGIKFAKLLTQFESAAKRAESGVVAGTEEGLTDAFMALDEVKRAAGKRARALGEKGGAKLRALEPSQRATREKLKTIYNEMRVVLEDDAWGSAAKKQAAVNEPWTQLLGDQEKLGNYSFQDAFTERRVVGTFGESAQVVSNKKVHDWLRGLHSRDASERLAGLNNYIRRAEELVAAGRAHLDLTPAKQAASAKIEAQAKRVKELVDHATTVSTHKMQFDTLTGTSAGGLTRAAVGHLVGGFPGAVVGLVAGVAGDPVTMIKQLSAIDRITGAGRQRVASALEEAGRRATTIPKRTFTVAAKIGTAITKTGLEVESYTRLRKQDVEYERRVATIAHIAEHPTAAKSLAMSAFRDISNAAPNTTEAAAAALARTISYLQRELPKVGLANPFVQKTGPSSTEKRTFNRKARAAENPAELLARVLSGKASLWDVDAVANTAPALYASMRSDALMMMTRLSQEGKALSYQDRSRLDLALGLGMEPMLDPDLMAEMQMPFAAPQPQQTPPSSAEMRKQSASSQTRPEAVSRPGA